MKRLGIIAFQLLVTAAGIFYVFHDEEKRRQVATALSHAQWSWLIAGWLSYGVVEALATVRWQILLRIQKILLSWPRAWAIVVIGLFFNMFLPGLIGGDVVRLYFVFKRVQDKTGQATLSVIMDRLLGLFSLLVLAAVVAIFRFDWLSRFRATAHTTYIALAILAAGFIVMGFLLVGVGFGLLNQLPSKTPFRNPILQAGEALNAYRTKPALLLVALIVTIVSHLAYYMSYYCALRSLPGTATHNSSMLDFFCVMPLVNAITGVPISFGGTGIRETLFQTLVGRLLNVPGALAAFAASLGFAIQASWGIVGAAVYLLLRSTGKKGSRNSFASASRL